MNIYENQLKSNNINKNQLNSMKLHEAENLSKSMESYEIH